MSSVNDIRSAFIDYFRQAGHEAVASGPLVPRNDPTLMFTNAGMVPFKSVFTGDETLPFVRAVTSQKCVRAGGKHNDLDNVGYTARHHTFFEMLGNFSFGDYFKERAIELAWKFLTGTLNLPESRLLVTVYGEDEEAFGLWKKIAGLSERRIIRISTSDNFWSMGDLGPCGPCSEIFYDHGLHIPGGMPGSADEDGDRFVEIWNLVFMQFEQRPGGRVDLPRPSIDTGMGLERLAAVLQGKHDNFDIDLFRSLIEVIERETGVECTGKAAVSHRVIADHLRACGFLIADGVLPANDGRGYVLRRIMRRAMRHAHLLGAQEPLLWRLVASLCSEMGQAWPELIRAAPLITQTLQLEETRFRVMLARGLGLLESVSATLDEGDVLPGRQAFRLYDTYGFPVDLTREALRARGISIDMKEFDAAMEQQRKTARASWAGSGDAAIDEIWPDLRSRLGPTEFLGYDRLENDGAVTALVCEGRECESLKAGQSGQALFNQTVFYGEAGGQAGDTGTAPGDSAQLRITATRKIADGLIVHDVSVEAGELRVGDPFHLRVDGAQRAMIRANHSATHLLHAALREVLGAHVAQRGSLVAADRLRFDFSHPAALAAEQITAIEDRANEVILQNAPVETTLMARDDAIASGAMALFGEKYGDEVRVVRMGRPPGDAPATGVAASERKFYSVELCGGTHAQRTGDIGLLTIIAEQAVAAGTRRIEALTGTAARRHLRQREEEAHAMAALLRSSTRDGSARLKSILDNQRQLERDLEGARRKLASGGGGGGEKIEEIDGIRLIARQVEDISGRNLKGMADEAKRSLGSGVVALVSQAGDGSKASVVVGVTDDLTDRLDAVALVRLAAGHLGGKSGGGRRDLAQAGGANPSGGKAALDAIRAALGQNTAA